MQEADKHCRRDAFVCIYKTVIFVIPSPNQALPLLAASSASSTYYCNTLPAPPPCRRGIIIDLETELMAEVRSLFFQGRIEVFAVEGLVDCADRAFEAVVFFAADKR